MKFAALIVLSLSAMALAGPAVNKQQQQQQLIKTTGSSLAPEQILKEWCSSSDLSQEQLTSSFKELVQAIKQQPEDQATEQAVMNERICQGLEQQSNKVTDTKAHELIKDVYMDALIACDTHTCMKQLNKIIDSHDVDSIRASYYMTRIAVSDKDSIKDDEQVITVARSFIQSPKKSSQAVERQQMFAVTALLNKCLTKKEQHKASEQVKKVAHQVASTIVDRYIKPCSQQEVKQYMQQKGQSSPQLAMKISKRNAALKALTNLPGWVIAESDEVKATCLEIAQCKQGEEMTTARQSAIECLEHCQDVQEPLKQICFDQEEPIEVRIAAYRTLMTIVSGTGKEAQQQQQSQQQQAEEFVKQVVEHCEDERNQQQDDQFVSYCISHLDNLSTGQQPEHKIVKECIKSNKQVNMKIQLLNKKFKRTLNNIRSSSRNYKLEQEFNQIDSGLIVEGDIIFDQQKQQKSQSLPKLVRVNMSMPVMGETVNVIEFCVRQNKMDEHFLSALNIVQGSAKFTGEQITKVMDTFKSSVSQQQRSKQDQAAEADLTIKIDGCTVVYLCVDDFKTGSVSPGEQHQRNTRSIYSDSMVEDIIEYLKRNPVAFNRGVNFNFNERLGKVLDVDTSLVAGLRFESRATGQSSEDFEIVAKAEPRFALEAIVGPAKVNKKLQQRLSTKTALGLRLRFKRHQLVDVQLDLPQQTMELFTYESKIVQETPSGEYVSIEGQEESLLPITYGGQNSIFNLISGSNKRSTVYSVDHTLQTSENSARALGVRGKFRVVVKSNMNVMVQALVQKYDPSMQGYRVQVQRVAGPQEQYMCQVSTPGSQIDRSTQVRLSKQSSSGRQSLKAEIKSPKMRIVSNIEVVHDGRQMGVKAELGSLVNSQWRHSLNAGVQLTSSARFGSYKPFLSIKSTELKRPVEMQGTITVQQEPKFIITYNMRCASTSDFVQGKIIVDQRSPRNMNNQYLSHRRSMRSPIELILERDLTLTNEIVAQVERYAVKAHSMLDWDSDKWAIQSDSTLTAKNLVKSIEQQLEARVKLAQDLQQLVVERRCPQQPRDSCRFALTSAFTSDEQHKFDLQINYYGKRQQQQVVALKHVVNFKPTGGNNLILNNQVEFISTEQKINEKLAGRTELSFERGMSSVHVDLKSLTSGRQCKIDVDFASLSQHQIELKLKGQEYLHQTSVRATERELQVQSHTDKYNQIINRLVVNYQKQLGDCQVVFECPKKNVRLAMDLKPSSGKQSSVAIQTPVIQSKAEFFFETMPSSSAYGSKGFLDTLMPIKQVHLMTDLNDLMNKEAYWMDTSLNRSPGGKSFLRMDSPIYRGDIEYDPSLEEARFGLFARSKRSIDSYTRNYEPEYMSGQDWRQNRLSPISGGQDKLFVIRSLISAPKAIEQLRQKTRCALLEYADKQQTQRHSLNYEPTGGSINFDLERKPIDSMRQSMQAMRLKGDLSKQSFFGSQHGQSRPSSISFDSDMLDLDVETVPYGNEESYAKLNVLSRYPRSAFKHQSEISHKKQKGYKAQMRHEEETGGHRHQWQLEADESPKKWAKMSYDSSRLGKGSAQYDWRRHLVKNPSTKEDMYANRLAWRAQGPRGTQDWSHETNFSWEEPRRIIGARYRRDLLTSSDIEAPQYRYNIADYLKHVNTHLSSRTNKGKGQFLNQVDFDYEPSSHARLNVQMPEDMVHSSSFEYQPIERLYKIQSKIYNQRTQKPSYQLFASTKPIVGLATDEQEPVFVNEQHSILSPLTTRNVPSIFKVPLKLDYSDKYGRVANIDYDFAPVASTSSAGPLYPGLRQKRAAIYYRDDDVEHSANYDFYPEAMLNVPGDLMIKSQTKYGPVVLRASSSSQETELKVVSPIVNAEISCENKREGKLFTINLDNKQQQVKLSKIVRQIPILQNCNIAKKIANKIDDSRVEHETELLVNFVKAMLKLKSETKMDERQIMVVDAQLDKRAQTCFAKINGEKVQGRLVADLMNKTYELVVESDDKNELQHQTRFTLADNQEYCILESMTTYDSKPVIKVNGKIWLDISDNFSRHHQASAFSPSERISTFDAVIFTDSKPKQITGQYDCDRMEGRVFYKDFSGRKASDIRVKYDDQSEKVYISAYTTSQNGTTNQIQKTFDISPLVEAY